MAVADIAVIGLAVMGQNLILNMNDHKFVVCAFNRTVSKVDDFLNKEAKGTQIVGAHSIEEMVRLLKKPRRIMMLVQAGAAVDSFIDQLVPHLEAGDIIIDGGNSEYHDSIRRCQQLESKGLLFIGTGVSGGEDGARYGPSLMPGGSAAAWPHVRDIFQSIAARTEDSPCCDWVGAGGAGHFVKMVHNGIEYGDMQLIAEAYAFMHERLRMNNEQIATVFETWNHGPLESFLIEITANILRFRDSTGAYLVDRIRDAAGQKGTGKWTVQCAADYGVPCTLIAEALFSRCISALKEERVRAAKVLPGPSVADLAAVSDKERDDYVEALRKGLYAAKIISYAQGFSLMRTVSNELHWDINLGAAALMWRGGCIIRSRFLGEIKRAFEKNPKLESLLLDDFFREAMTDAEKTPSWRSIIVEATRSGLPTAAFGAAISYYDAYRSAHLPANIIQAQRDYFGAHQFELLDNPGTFQHANWTGHGGSTTSTAYQHGATK